MVVARNHRSYWDLEPLGAIGGLLRAWAASGKLVGNNGK